MDKPLIYWTIKLANKCKFFNKIVVSSDNSYIQNIVKDFGKTEFIKRPKKISGKNIKMESVVKHTINMLKKRNEEFDAVAILQPTSPLRKLKTIEKCCKIFSSNKYDTLATVTKLDFKSDPKRTIKIKSKNLFLQNFNYSYNKSEKIYKLDGGVIFIKKIKKLKNKILKGKTRFFEINYPESIDIDTSFDFKKAEIFFNKNDIYK